MIADNKDIIDLRKLTVEEQRPVHDDFRFVLEEEVDPKFVKDYVQSLTIEAVAVEKRARSAAFAARLLKVNAKFRTNVLTKLTHEFFVAYNSDNWQRVPDVYSTFKLINSHQNEQVVQSSYDDHAADWQTFKNIRVRFEENVDTLVNLKICLPGAFDKLKFTSKDREEMLQTLRGNSPFANVLNYAANIKMLVDFEPSELFSKEQFSALVKSCRLMKTENNSILFISTAADLAVVAAERVEFGTDGSINLIQRSRYSEQPDIIPAVPELRKY